MPPAKTETTETTQSADSMAIPIIAASKVVGIRFMRSVGLTYTRQPKRRIFPACQGRIMVAFVPVVIEFPLLVAAKMFPAKAAFAIGDASGSTREIDQC